MAGIWLGRVPLAKNLAESACRDRDLDCDLDLTRLDFGGATFQNLRIGGDGGEPVLAAERLTVDLDWSSPFSARPERIGGRNIVLRLNLTGEGPVLGELQEVIHSLSDREPTERETPMPQLDLENVRVIAATALGPVEATGGLKADSAQDFQLQFKAQPARFESAAGSMSFSGGELQAQARNGQIDGRLLFRLDELETEEASVSGAVVDLALRQSGEVLTGQGSASLSSVAAGGGRLSGAQAEARLEAAALDLDDLSTASLLARVRELSVDGRVEAGSAPGAEFSDGVLNARLLPREGGGAAGEVSVTARSLRAPVGAAERLDIGGQVELPGNGPGALGKALRASGTATLSGASLDAKASEEVSGAVASPLQGVLPVFAAAAARAARRAGERFELVLPWSFQIDGEGFDASALDGTSIKSASGLRGDVSAMETAEPTVFAYSSRGHDAWRAAGEVSLSGGGAPPLTVHVENASSGGEGYAAGGDAKLGPWAVGSQVLTADLVDFSLAGAEGRGQARGTANATLTGQLAGLDWTRGRAATSIDASWNGDALRVEAAEGVALAWESLSIDKTRLGAASLTYRPDGPLALKAAGEALGGTGQISRLEAPVTGDGYTATLTAGPTRISWSAADATVVDFRIGSLAADVRQGEAAIPVSFPSASGRLRLKDGWTLTGELDGGEASTDAAKFLDIEAGLELSGAEGRDMSGRLRNVGFSVVDPSLSTARRFEDAQFEGEASLDGGWADFSGVIALEEAGVQLGTVAGRHELASGEGSLAFTGAPLIFRPNGLQPYALSPLLRGPANVDGRIDISGTAAWTADDFNATASASVTDLDFALAAAGLFEGVNGRIEVNDLVNMKSAPGQTVTLDRVTLGMPFESGRISFQLVGYDGVRLESASWPFAGGRINIRPVDYTFAGRENRFVAEAVDWDLAAIIEQFKIPDLEAEGRVSGVFPIVFSTGSARIDHAVLEASEEGGVIQYTGSTGDAAASANDNAKLLFDALKDFRYRVMRLGLDGDLAGRMLLTVDLLGRNPEVLYGSAFDIGISIDSPLMDLLNVTGQAQDQVDAVVRAITGSDN